MIELKRNFKVEYRSAISYLQVKYNEYRNLVAASITNTYIAADGTPTIAYNYKDMQKAIEEAQQEFLKAQEVVNELNKEWKEEKQKEAKG